MTRLGENVETEVENIIAQLCGCIDTGTLSKYGKYSKIKDVEKRKDKIEIDTSKWVQKDIDNFNLVSDNLNSLALFACSFIGTKYTYGGASIEGGFDCSAFVQYVYSQYEITLPRTSSEQLKLDQRGDFVAVSLDDAKPGDIVCYSGHVAIYLGSGKIVHASNSANYYGEQIVNEKGDIVNKRGGVKIDNINYITYLKILHYTGAQNIN